MAPHDKNTENESEEEPFGLGCALEYFVEVNEVMEIIDNLKNIFGDKSLKEKTYERFHFLIGQYKEQSHLLDSSIDNILKKFIEIIKNDNSMELKHTTFQFMFVIVNVRGYKVIIRHLPHEVADFEPVLKLLEAQNPLDADTWATRYILLLWLSIIVMIPFDLSRFDDFQQVEGTTIMERVLSIIKTYIIVADKSRDAASYLSARFITRHDVKEKHLPTYYDWTMSLSLNPESNVFVKYGTLTSVATILKHGKREDLLPHAQKLLQWIVSEEIKNNQSILKLVYKIIQRIGLTFLPPRIASWRYKRGNRSLAANLSSGDAVQTSSENQNEDEHTTDDVDVPEEVEEVIDQLIQGLRSTDGVVRWSAAKGIGRVTGRLPKDLADEVVGSVLELFNLREGDGAWHGGCLALAELGRRGLLLPKRLPEVVPVILKALIYDEPRGYSSVGSHIRDAACYVCWSFARAYDTQDLRPFVKDIAATLLIVTCFDREINCRRAASAAFQENVGRQGAFPHGIDILTVADFFAVSIRNNAYLNISIYIAGFNEYTKPLINHLLTKKVDHWDCVIRELTAKTLHNLTPKAPEYMISDVLPTLFEKAINIDLNGRHGAVLAIGEILYALSLICKEKNVEIGDYIGIELFTLTKDLISHFYEKFYFRGMGGELMRQGCCDFIEKCSLASLNFQENVQITTQWLNLLNECIAYNIPNIQLVAINALPKLLNKYYLNQVTKCNELVESYIHQMLSATLQEHRMGHALALGVLPKFILLGNLQKIIDALIECSVITGPTQKWAESRRDAIKALTNISVALENEMGNEFTIQQIQSIYKVFLEGLKDYTQDKRGDVGAWVREASMLGLQILTSKVAEKHNEILDEDLVTNIISGIAQQAVERIDRTRALAAKVFYNFLYNESKIPNIQYYDDLIKMFDKEELDSLNWNSAADTFPKFVELLSFEPYSYNVMLGMICSIGGLTETLVKNSSSSLFHYLRREEKSKGVSEINRLCNIIYQIFNDNKKNDRIMVPMLRFLDNLLGSGCLLLITEDSNSLFTKNTLKLIISEITGCKDVYKLKDGIGVLSQFVQIKNECCPSALVQLSILLCHRQSYVRRSTATALYESLLIYGDTTLIKTENLGEVMQILSETNWEEPVDVIKPIRNQLCNLLGIRVPVPKMKT